jgi:hypothetical protein
MQVRRRRTENSIALHRYHLQKEVSDEAQLFALGLISILTGLAGPHSGVA